MKRTTAEWVRKADADYRSAQKLVRGRESFHDQVCFHCQQATEKFLKALLEELGQPIPYTHNLRDVLSLLVPYHSSLRTYRRGVNFLTRFAVGIRYPGDTATKRQTEAALRWAGRVRQAVSAILGIKLRRSV
jgi:HEPN domain-containing protein